MKKKQDRETRYFVDLDLGNLEILGWDYDQRQKLILQKPTKPTHHRIYITKGQYNKLKQKNLELRNAATKKT